MARGRHTSAEAEVGTRGSYIPATASATLSSATRAYTSVDVTLRWSMYRLKTKTEIDVS